MAVRAGAAIRKFCETHGLPAPSILLSSPLLRCVETAAGAGVGMGFEVRYRDTSCRLWMPLEEPSAHRLHLCRATLGSSLHCARPSARRGSGRGGRQEQTGPGGVRMPCLRPARAPACPRPPPQTPHHTNGPSWIRNPNRILYGTFIHDLRFGLREAPSCLPPIAPSPPRAPPAPELRPDL